VVRAQLLTQLQNKELEATEERKRKAKQLEMQRKESGRSGRSAGGMSRPSVYPTYTPPVRPAVTETYDTYEAEKNKSKYATPLVQLPGHGKLTIAGSPHPRARACSWAKSPRPQICLSA
jgi:hypothetical protein